MNLTGEFAAVFAALAFSITSTLFTLAGRRLSPAVVNRTSLAIGLVGLFALNWATTGQPFPVDVEAERWLLLGASGLIGYWLLFLALMYAFQRIGPRLALLIAALGPILGAVLAWLLLDEALAPSALLGIALTIGGIAFVVSEGNADDGTDDQPFHPDAAAFRTGVLLALFAAGAQGVSVVLIRQGMAGDFQPVTGNYMRLLVGAGAAWGFALLTGQAGDSLRVLRTQPLAMRQLSAGALAGPIIGASLLVLSLDYTSVGISSTLSNLTPIFLIPIGYLVFHERITRRAVIGTLIAITGTAILFL